ncbi:MAG: diguanylate cyclase [Gammaproteobacteria bacterium]|nr:MAG: diguanylate cyclase [Gammaproteobacteria bacterium]
MSGSTAKKYGFDSVFARQLDEGFPWLKFTSELEPGFRSAHSERLLPYVRAALFVGLTLMLAFFVLGLVSGRSTNDWFANLIRFGLLAPVFVVTIVVSYLPRQQVAFRSLLLMTAIASGLGYAVLNLTASEQYLQAGFSGLLVIVAFIYFALGLFMRTAMIIVLVVTVFYGIGASFVGVPTEFVAYNLALLLVANFACGLGSYALEHALRAGYLESQLLSELVERDGLTGLYNRRAFDKYFAHAWDVAKRQRKSLAVMLADLDHFKAYNDQHGHQAGDECLRRVASRLAMATRRPLDFAGRFGGEEFILVFFDVGLEASARLAEDIRRHVAELNIPHRGSGTSRYLTVSIGVSVASPGETARSPEGVLQLSDQAMYQAKNEGRNRIQVADASEAHIQTGVFQPG